MPFSEVSRAASPEGIIALAVLYFLFAMFAKARKAAQKGPRPQGSPAPRPGAAAARAEPAPSAFSLEAVLREIERVKQEAERRSAPADDRDRPRHVVAAAKPRPEGDRPRQLPATERKGRMAKAMDEKGPLGRHAKTRLPASEEFEDRTSLEDGGSIEVAGRLENLDERRRRIEVDQDDDAEALVLRRIQQADARNRAFSESDHQNFHDKIRQTESAPVARKAILTTAQLRQAFVWREILGPPKGLE